MAKQAPGEHREEQRRGRTYSASRRYHRGMARQCPRGHNGTKPGEGADDTSASHHTLTSIRSRRGESQAARDKARGRHGRDPEHRRRQRREHQRGNRLDLSDRQERRHEIYRLAPISAANSGGGRRNQVWWQRGDAVTRAGERKEKR
jgi:hypothetical protein